MSLRVFTIILDGLGVGDLPDSRDYGDHGCNTLAHLAAAAGGVSLPALEGLGLGKVQPFDGMDAARPLSGAYGRMAEKSRGKDSTTGHWELAGLLSDRPPPLYPDGFPDELLAEISERSGYEFIGNEAASGTEIIERLGDEHVATGRPIAYTSADSVFQVAAHEGAVPLEALYELCRSAREILRGPHAVSRVIARPFEGESGAYRRTAGRRDFSLAPPGETLLDGLLAAGVRVMGVGKVVDLFAGRGFTGTLPSKSNAEGMAVYDRLLAESEGPVFHLLNLVDFDMIWGHRRDPRGYADALRDFDAWLGRFLARLEPADRLLITADHGNDPTAPGFDHTREYVPILVARPGMAGPVDLGTRDGFHDFAASVAEGFGLEPFSGGRSFWQRIEEGSHG